MTIVSDAILQIHRLRSLAVALSFHLSARIIHNYEVVIINWKKKIKK